MLKQLSVTALLTAILTVPGFSQIQLKVTLSGTPSSVNIEKKNLKYGKYGVFCMIWDDRSFSAANAFPVMPAFTDGAGNNVPFTAGVAFNSVNRYGVDFPGLSFTQIKDLVEHNWGISCHGYIHNSSDWPAGFTVEDNVRRNREYLYQNLQAVGTEYIIRTGVVPSNDAGYNYVWKANGSLCSTSQNQFDGLPAIPQYDYTNNSVGDISHLNGEYHVFARGFGDIVSQSESDRLMNKLGTLIGQSTPAANKILVFGTHQTDNLYFGPVLDYIKNNSNDRIWVTSMHELMEYGETTANTNISYTVSGNVVTITLDQHVPDINRWRDISLELNTDQQILDVTFTGADRVSFNGGTGLINVFKKKVSGFSLSNSANIVLPLHFTSFSVKRNELAWTTDDKDNLSHFEIERSVDGTHFSTIGQTIVQTFRDPAPLQDQYYRIKAVEKTGKFLYSTTLHHTNNLQKHAAVSQTGKALRLQFFSPRQQPAPVQVFNAGGQLVYHSNIRASYGWNFITIDSLPRHGMYVFKVLNETVVVSR